MDVEVSVQDVVIWNPARDAYWRYPQLEIMAFNGRRTVEIVEVRTERRGKEGWGYRIGQIHNADEGPVKIRIEPDTSIAWIEPLDRELKSLASENLPLPLKVRAIVKLATGQQFVSRFIDVEGPGPAMDGLWEFQPPPIMPGQVPRI